MAKAIQKGVEVAYHKLNPQQRAAVYAARTAEIQSWVGSKVARAAGIHVPPDEALKMRWIYTFKSVPDDSSKMKAKARVVVLGYSDPSLLERDTSSPALTRTSKMLLLTTRSPDDGESWPVMSEPPFCRRSRRTVCTPCWPGRCLSWHLRSI